MPEVTEARLRAHLATAERIVVKVGSSSLTSADGGSLNPAAISSLTEALAARARRGAKLVLVSSGAIAAGIRPLGLGGRPSDLATQQAAASVGQGALIAAYTERFAAYGLTVGQVLLTADDTTRRSHYTNAKRTLERLLELGIVPIVNENDTVATSEIKFGDNDRLAALVSHLVRADALVLLTDVDALYDSAPSTPGARRITVVSGPDDLAAVSIGGSGSAVGSGGMSTKVEAALIAGGAGIPTVLAAATAVGPALAGAPVGTIFAPRAVPARSRKFWLAHATTARGRIVLDEGAVKAVAQRRKSLLPAGITSVDGLFSAGDPVDLCAADGRIVARGLVNFSAAELPRMIGRSTRDLARELGSHYEREVVHRDDLVVL